MAGGGRKWGGPYNTPITELPDISSPPVRRRRPEYRVNKFPPTENDIFRLDLTAVITTTTMIFVRRLCPERRRRSSADNESRRRETNGEFSDDAKWTCLLHERVSLFLIDFLPAPKTRVAVILFYRSSRRRACLWFFFWFFPFALNIYYTYRRTLRSGAKQFSSGGPRRESTSGEFR